MSRLLGTLLVTFSFIAVYVWFFDLPAGMGDQSLGKLSSPQHMTITVGQRGTFRVEVVDTDAERTRGLSGRTSFGSDEGMFFIFDTPDKHGFWMKDMHFPIDIVWFNESGRVIWIENDVPPDSYPRIFRAPSPDKYVLELPSGIAARRGILIGDQMEILQSH
jgi:uncharacterized membrane protein (UPF0127 family)